MKKNHMSKSLAFVTVLLFIGIGIHPVYAIYSKTSSDSTNAIHANEKFSKITLDQDKQETFGFYQGLIIGRISSLQGSGDRVKFWARSILIISGIIFQQRTYLNQRWVELDKPYLGIILPTFICVIGTCSSGW